MAAIRTLIVTVPPLLRDLVVAVLPPQSLDVIAVLDTRAALAARLAALAPDLVLLGLRGTETDAVARPLLALRPRARVLVLAADARAAWLHQAAGPPAALPGLSAAALRAALLG